jgi:hypothetical protein
MTLIDTFKQQVAQTTDLAKLKTLIAIASARVKAIEAAPAEEAPAEETVQPEGEESLPEGEVGQEAEEIPEVPADEEVPSVDDTDAGFEESAEEAVEEPVAPVKKVVKPAPTPAKKAPPPKAPAKPKLAVGSRVYGPPVPIKFKFRNADKQVMNVGDMYSFEGKIEKIEGDKAILGYTDKERPLGLGKDAPVRVRVSLSALEPVQ